jgi:hypothetical protein
MKEARNLILNIFDNVKKLVDKNEQLIKEIESLRHQNIKLKGELIKQDELLVNLQQDLDVVKITGTINSDDDRLRTKAVVDGLVRKIDKSLNLLNK